MFRAFLLAGCLALLPAVSLRADEAPPATAPVPAWLSAVTPRADLRFRHELIDGQGQALRNRERIRARVGVGFALPPDVDLFVGLATGNDGDPVSTNQTLTGAFAKKPLWLDLAYADWHPGFVPGLHLVLGRQKNPFVAPGRTELIWDHDLNPEGAALTWSRRYGAVEPFAAADVSFVDEREKARDALLLGAQAGLRGTFLGDSLWFAAGGSYFDYTATRGAVVYFDPARAFGNGVDTTDPAALRYLHDYDLVEGFVEVGGSVLGVPITAVADLVKNLAVADDGLGWLVGATLGRARAPYSFELRYSYREVGGDAVLGAFTDSDFRGGGADGKGHEAGVDFVLGAHVTLGATCFFNQKGVDGGSDYQRAQFDVSFRL